MSMLPAFMVGLLVGIVATCAWYTYKSDTPSNMKIELQEKEIARRKSDNEMLHDLINRLYQKIDKLETELNETKNK